jgi:hypothetical protein
LVGFADDIDKRHFVFDAELDKHLAQIRGCSRVHQPGMTLAAHGFQHSQSRQGIDEG